MTVKVLKDVIGTDLPLLDIPGIKAYLTDVTASDNTTSPIAAGMFRLDKSNPLDFTYKYDEMKIVLEGEVTVEDEQGTSHELVAGDLIQFSKGAKVIFSTPSSGLMFYVAQRKFGEL
ncbi:cupin domain-containing protein [Psychromonas sp. L1A2]|uniref:cupin domain-containing protein n=1 Tax=Psychromonas sp. L1A2 TaxID=2686356 RepID=UPI00135C4CCD|nr:cupin domain-containing protein [Psychromonas sp. L1A2]